MLRMFFWRSAGGNAIDLAYSSSKAKQKSQFVVSLPHLFSREFFNSPINDKIIDNIIDDFECNHDMEFLTDVSDENYNKLEKMLNDTVIRWIDECGYKPSGVELDEELHKVLV